MKKVLLPGLVGVVIGILIAAFLFVHYQPRPGPGEPVKVTENPSSAHEKKAHIVIQEKRAGEMVSRVEITQPDRTDSEKKVLTLQVGEKFSAPSAGEIKTVYLNRSGQQIGEGIHQVAGETTVTVGQELLDISTRFDDQVTVAVDVPDPPRKLWHVGGYLVTDFDRVGVGGFTQRDFGLVKIGRMDVVAFGRMEVDWDRRLMAGIEFSF